MNIMKFQVNLQAYWFNMIKGAYIFTSILIQHDQRGLHILQAYWFNMIKGAYIFYEIIIKSQIISNKFI